MRTLKEIIDSFKNGVKSCLITDEESVYLLDNFNKTTKLIYDEIKLGREKDVREVEYLFEGRLFDFVFTIDKKSGKNDSIMFSSMFVWELCGEIKIT